MKLSLLSALSLLAFLIQLCQGLELTFDLTPIQGSRASCGVLNCLEKSQDTASTTDVAQHLDDTVSISQIKRVKKMTVYRLNDLGIKTATSKAVLVASVDSHHPSVTRVANAIKVDGSLGDSVTSIRVEFFKQEDCKAQYTCEVLAVDSSDRELVRTSHLYQQPSTSASGGTSGEIWTPAVAMHLVNLVMELNLNVELMKSAMNEYGDKINDVESKVETVDKDLTALVVKLDKEVGDKLVSAEKGLREKFDVFETRFSDKFESVDRKLYKLTLSKKDIDEKLDSTAKQIQDKLNEQDKKMDASLSKLQDAASEVAEFKSSLSSFIDNFEDEVKDKIETIYKDNAQSLALNITYFSDELRAFQTSTENKMQLNFESLKSEIEEQGTKLKNNLKRALEETVFSASMNIASRVNRSYDLLDESIEGFVKEIASNINESALETRSSFIKTALSLNISDADEIASMVTSILTPKTCRKGVISLLTQPAYPYPLVQPSSDASLTVPYLCDTVTDGGGWIVIQRRTTGNTDFYRFWTDYKVGFGTLDDDFWLGNDNIHTLTSTGEYELRVDMRYGGMSKYAHYSKFALSDESDNYSLTLGPYEGTAGDSLFGHAGSPFTTRDKDNDRHGANCAVIFTGAWWYTACHGSNLNGQWNQGANKGPRWSSFTGDNPASFTEMKIRKLG